MDRKGANNMTENKPIPEMNSYEETAEFWDTHSLADYWDQTEPAEFEISPELHRRYLVAVESGLLNRLRQAAYARGVSTESLINLLLEQRLHEIEST
jgi:predicted DNA binding CopG/RHH family protein